MPFLYDVWNVKLRLYAQGIVWSRGGGGGGSTSVKLFSISYMLNSKNSVFNPNFLIGTCPMTKTLLRIIRVLNLLSFSWKKYHFLWNFFLAIFMANPSLRLSEVLWTLTLSFTKIGIIYNKITHPVLRTRQIEHILINLNRSFRSRKRLEKWLKCDNSVNRGRSVLKTSLWNIKHVLSKTQRKRHSDVHDCITSR